MTFFLTSNGLNGTLAQAFASLLTKPAADTSVLFDVTAAYGENENPTWVYDSKAQVEQQGISHITTLDLRNTPQKDLEGLINAHDIIYVNGGNTFFLLYWVRKSGFDKVLHKFLNSNNLYVGISAGSILVTPTIAIAGVEPADKKVVAIEDLTGLNLVDFEISPHVPNVVSYESVEKYSKSTPHAIYALDDNAAVVVQDGKVTTVGNGVCKVFNASTT